MVQPRLFTSNSPKNPFPNCTVQSSQFNVRTLLNLGEGKCQKSAQLSPDRKSDQRALLRWAEQWTIL